jgi:hypothetical protein
MRPAFAAIMALLCVRLTLAEPPSTVEVTLDPPKFGDVSSILKVDSTVASFKFDAPVRFLALVLEAYPKEPQSVPVARLALDLAQPVTEGRLCVQMVDQGFLPVGNGAPHQMQLFMQLDCGGTLISSSQSFLKEKFNFSKSLARMGTGTVKRSLTGSRVPIFWLMGNSDSGTYFNDGDVEKMVAKNRDAYILIASLETSKDGPALAQDSNSPKSKASPAAPSPAIVGTTAALLPFMGPPYPVPVKDAENPKDKEPAAVTSGGGEKRASAKSSPASTSQAKKKKKRRS